MNPLEWLRRQNPPLSPRHCARFLEVCEAMDAAVRAGEGPIPVAVIRIDDVMTRADEAEIRTALTVTPRPRRDASFECGCWPRYTGNCRCTTIGAS